MSFFEDTDKASRRRRSLVHSASKKLFDLRQPRSKKERLTDNEHNHGITISAPFNFRDLSKESSASSASESATNLSSGAQRREPIIKPYDNPRNKPLPSLPVATIITGSPVKVRRSIIDAEEKPLRRSLSPRQQIWEDWPSLTPQKHRCTEPTKMPTPTKPSISEGLAERIKKLNLEDDNENKQVSSSKIQGSKASPTSSPAVDQTQPPKSIPNTKSSLPPVRQNKASELRLRLSAGYQQEQKAKKTNLPSPLASTSGNVTVRARPVKRPNDGSRARAAVNRSRSRSRHRVTAQGSPYVLPGQTDKIDGHQLKRRSSLKLDPTKIDTNFNHGGIIKNPAQNHVSNEDRMDNLSDKNITTDVRDGNDDQNLDVNSSPRSDSVSESNVGFSSSTHEIHDSRSNTAIDSLTSEVMNSTLERGPQSSSTADIGSNDLQEAEGTNDERMSSIAPNSGLMMPISPTVDDILRGIGACAQNKNSKCDDVLERCTESSIISPPTSQNRKFRNDGEIKTTSAGDGHSKSTVECVNPISDYHRPTDQTSSEVQRIPRKPVLSSQGPFNKRLSLNATPVSAPTIRPGLPKDNTSTTAWPFKESAIAPFKTIVTPERNTTRPFIDLTEPGKDGANQTQQTTGNEQVNQNRYNINEALHKIKPHEGAKFHNAIFANTTPLSEQTAIVKDPGDFYPPRTSSRRYDSARLTGFRTPSQRKPSLPLNHTPRQQTPHDGNSASFPQHMRSFQNSSHTIANSCSTLPRNDNNKPLSSPLPTPSTVPTGKGVLNNIRGLIHKHSRIHGSIYGSLHRSTRSEKDFNTSSSRKSSVATNAAQTFRPSPIPQPRSPQVKATSSPATREASRSTPKVFPTNRIVRPFASSSPPDNNTNIASPETINEKEKNPLTTTTTPDPKPKKIEFDTSTFEPPEIQAATQLVHSILDRAQQQPGTRKMEQLMELSKILVQILSSAREAEQALQQANIAAARCEMKCVEIRRDMNWIERFVREEVEELDCLI